MNGTVAAMLANITAFVALLSTYVYRQGKADGERSQIIQRVDRIETILNHKE